MPEEVYPYKVTDIDLGSDNYSVLGTPSQNNLTEIPLSWLADDGYAFNERDVFHIQVAPWIKAHNGVYGEEMMHLVRRYQSKHYRHIKVYREERNSNWQQTNEHQYSVMDCFRLLYSATQRQNVNVWLGYAIILAAAACGMIIALH